MITIQRKFKVTLENYDGRCKRATVLAFDGSDAFAEASMRFPGWVCVEVVPA